MARIAPLDSTDMTRVRDFFAKADADIMSDWKEELDRLGIMALADRAPKPKKEKPVKEPKPKKEKAPPKPRKKKEAAE